MAASLTRLRELIEALPAHLGSTEQQLQELAAALADNAEAAEELAAARTEAEQRLAVLQDAHALLAEAQLRARER